MSGVILHTLPPWLSGCFIGNGIAPRGEDWAASAAKYLKNTYWVKVLTCKPLPWTSGDFRPALIYCTSQVTVSHEVTNTLRCVSPLGAALFILKYLHSRVAREWNGFRVMTMRPACWEMELMVFSVAPVKAKLSVQCNKSDCSILISGYPHSLLVYSPLRERDGY